jgi:hypothetical protein
MNPHDFLFFIQPGAPVKLGRPKKAVPPADSQPSAPPVPATPAKRGRPRKVVVPPSSQPSAPTVPAENITSNIPPSAPSSKHAAPVETPANDKDTIKGVTSTELAASQNVIDTPPLAKKRKLRSEVQEGVDSVQLPETSSAPVIEATAATEQDTDTSKKARTLRKRTAEQDAEKETAKKSKEEPKKTRSTTTKNAVEKKNLQQGGLMTWLRSAPSMSGQKATTTTPPINVQPVTTSPPRQDHVVVQPMQVDPPVVTTTNTDSLKRGRAFQRIAAGASSPVVESPSSSGSVSAEGSMAKENSPSKETTRNLFTAVFPQKDAPSYIGGQKVGPFPESWKTVSISEKNANLPYFKKRVEALLKVMQSKKFAFFDKAFMGDVAGALDPSLTMASTGLLDRKSVMRATFSAVRNGDLLAYPLEFKRLSGTVVAFVLLLWPGTPLDLPELLDCVAALREVTYVPSGRVGVKPALKMKEMKVERLADRIKRLESSLENDDGSNARARLQMLKSTKRALEIQGRTKKYQGIHSSMVRIAMRHGFVIAKMLRAKIFMQCLRQMADAHNSNIVITENICRGMTLRAFAQVIGVFVDTPATREALSNPHKMNTSLQLLDNQTKKAIWVKAGQRLRSRVCQNLDVVHALGMVKPSVGDSVGDGNTLSSSFILSDTAKLRDYSKPGLPVVDVLPVRTMDEIEEYWRRLQSLCLKVAFVPDEGAEETERRLEELKNEQSQLIHEKDYIAGILTSPAWEGKFLYTDKQIKMLDAYVDIEHRRTPYDDPILCEEIAANTGLPVKRVQQYYRQVQAYRMRRKKRNRKFPRPGEEGLVTEELTTIHMAPFRPTPPWIAKRGRKSVIYRRNVSRANNENPADDENIPIVDHPEGKFRANRKMRENGWHN